MIRALLVDDEPPARRELRRLLAAFADVQVIGEAADVASARGLALRSPADVVFLDIALGQSSGFELLDDLPADTAVIFVTAYDQHAVRAFEASALDYLVKPVEEARLAASLERLRIWRRERAQPVFNARAWVFLETAEGAEFVEIAQVAAIIAERGATRVWTHDGRTRITSSSLEQWQQRLPADDFIKLNRATLVNLRHVRHVEPWSNYSYRLQVAGVAEPLTMSRRQAASLRGLLG